MKARGDEPAFPLADQAADWNQDITGLTKRDYEMIAYRAAALTGLWSAMGDKEFSRFVHEEAERRGLLTEQLIAAMADENARAAYAAAHPEESDK